MVSYQALDSDSNVLVDLKDTMEGPEDSEPELLPGQEYSIPTSLYRYQAEDVERLLADEDRNYMILSEMGTGKTPEIISVAEMGGYKNVLILCPKSLRREWERQIIQWTGEAPIVCNRGSGRRLDPYFEVLQGKRQASKYFILNYETFRLEKHVNLLQMMPFDLIVMDEVHNLRNAETKTTRGIINFLAERKSSRVIVLSGSPIVNTPLDLYTILMILRPEAHSIKTRFEFLERYTHWAPNRGRPKVYGMKAHMREDLQRYIDPMTIKRTKEEVLPDLPNKYKKVVTLEMEEDQEEVYRKLAKQIAIELESGESIHSPGVLGTLIRLRQANLDPRILGLKASSTKTEYLMELVEDGPEKLVIFSTFAQYVNLLVNDLNERGIKNVFITGDVQVDKRADLVKQFQEDPDCRVILGTIKTMGEGLTLTAASDVVLADRWWTPTANNQAIDRLHRIGQENAVQVLLPTNVDSIDQHLDLVLEEKEKIVGEIFSDGSVMQEVLENLKYEVSRWL